MLPARQYVGEFGKVPVPPAGIEPATHGLGTCCKPLAVLPHRTWISRLLVPNTRAQAPQAIHERRLSIRAASMKAPLTRMAYAHCVRLRADTELVGQVAARHHGWPGPHHSEQLDQVAGTPILVGAPGLG